MNSSLFKNSYIVYDDGRIYSLKTNHFLKHNLDDWGYPTIGLRIDGKRKTYKLHRLIWEAFNGEPPTGYHVHHKNENKEDASLGNLELVESGKHMALHNKEKWAQGKMNPLKALTTKKYNHVYEQISDKRSKPLVQITPNNNIIMWKGIQECKRNGFSAGNISLCCNGNGYCKNKHRYKGSEWFWLEDYQKHQKEEANLEQLASSS